MTRDYLKKLLMKLDTKTLFSGKDWAIDGVSKKVFEDEFGDTRGIFLMMPGTYIGCQSELMQTKEKNQQWKPLVDAGVLPKEVLGFNFRGAVWHGMTVKDEDGIMRGYDPKNTRRKKPKKLALPAISYMAQELEEAFV